MNSHEDAPTRKFNEATLARVKKEMDAPRITESARNEEASQPGHAGFGKAAIIQRGKESRAARARVNAAEKEKMPRLGNLWVNSKLSAGSVLSK
jgi:hypothetical protein